MISAQMAGFTKPLEPPFTLLYHGCELPSEERKIENTLEAGGAVQLAEHMPWVPSPVLSNWALQCILVTPAIEKWRQEDTWNTMASYPILVSGNDPVSKGE